MKDTQEIFDQMQELKKEQKEIRRDYQDALETADNYEELKEKIKGLRDKKKRIEQTVQGKLGARYGRLEEIKDKLKEKNQLMSDVAMSRLAEGESIEIKDEFNNQYEPVYKVTFKKIK